MGATNSREVQDSVTPGAAKCISYEVILSPRVQNVGEPRLTPKRERMLTRQDIDEKIAAAERRRKTRELDMHLKFANKDERGEEVRQAMTDYEERKRRETEARYQRRLFIFAENQDAIAAERADQWEEKAKKIEAAKQTVCKREKTFRESVKEKLSQKFEKFKENYTKYHVDRQQAARLSTGRIDIVQSSKERQIEAKALATAEKIRRKFKASQENREASINERVAKIQKQQEKIEEAKWSLERSMEVSSAKKLMQLEVRLDRSAVKRQLFENEIRKKATADLDKVERAKKLRQEQEQQFSECVKENLQQKFENAEKNREQNMVARQQVCQQEYTKVRQTKEMVEEQIRSQEKATEEKMQAKLNAYKENRQRRLSERKTANKSSNRASLQEITNDSATAEKAQSTTTEAVVENSCSKKVCCEIENDENKVDAEKLKELAENFRNRNLEHLGVI